MANDYSTLTERLVTELSSALGGSYGGLVVERRNWDPARLPDFSRYAIIVSPDQRPVTERRIAVPQIQYLMRVHLYLLVRNWEDSFPEPALWGTTAGSLGLFELVKDVKDLLRLSNLGGLLDKTYDEAAGDAQSPGQGGGSVEYGTLIPGFTASEYALLYPARIPYLARINPFCHARL
jgi:hypothetical protein